MSKLKKNKAVEKIDSNCEEKFTQDQYSSAAKSAQLLSIQMTKQNCAFNPEVEDSKKSRLILERNVVQCDFDEDQNIAAAIFRYKVTKRIGRKNLFSIDSEFVVFYSFDAECTTAAAKGYAHNVGMFAAYPYFRANVSQAAWNCGIELPPLPAIASTAHIPKKANAIEPSVD